MTTRAELRSRLIRQCSNMLLGPMEPDEKIGAAPSDTYLTGILWPRGTQIGAEEDEGDAGPVGDRDDEAEAAVPGYRAIRPCSIGLTFSVDAGTRLRVSLGRTARYHPVECPLPPPDAAPETTSSEETSVATATVPADAGPAEAAGDESTEQAAGDGEQSSFTDRHWVRDEIGYWIEIPAVQEKGSRSECQWQSAAGPVSDPDITLHIRQRISGSLQVVTLTLINSAPEPPQNSPKDTASLFQTEIVVEASDESGRVRHIRPRQLPESAGGDEDAEMSALLYRDIREFAIGHGVAAMWSDPVEGAVDQIRTTWLPVMSVKDTSASGHAFLQDFLNGSPEALAAKWLSRPEARDEIVMSLRKFTDCYTRWIETVLGEQVGAIPAGLRKAADLNLARCGEARNRMLAGIAVIARGGPAWTAFVLANEAMDRQSRFSAKGEKAGALVWRPFQLAYLLMVLPGLSDPREFEADRRRMDLLWFPTGGGKTEAYLGLTAFVIFFRRLSDARHGARGGIDVLMRYTLRLLTVQQFQRAAALITACEFMRLERSDLGTAPISIGLYVGADSTPNRMTDAIRAIEEEHRDHKPRSTPRQLLDCPVCGSSLPPRSYTVSEAQNAVEIRCSNSACETAGRPLPVLTVDDQIYAAPPSLLIGTIDKFAQLPRREDLRRLFGLDGRRRPELVVQDELHLISGPLGSMAGLYETAIDLLSTHDGIPPKIIGSTATIGQAARQVRALFDREVSQFPPPGFDAGDSFFAVRDDTRPDRQYLGVCSAGRSPKFALQAVTAAALEGAGTLVAGENPNLRLADAFWTCVLYFNSLRELGGAYTLLQDDVPRQMEFLASRLPTPRRIMEQPPVELSSRINSRDLPEALRDLERGLGDEDPFAPPPRDSVLASNMISVGVDISRLGLMIVNGQPKSTAEYIQATSRVGRGIEGLVITLYNFGRPRDLSHFEHFAGYHSALYRSVEATSVTPWAPRARDKALHAMFAAIIRHLVEGMSGDDAAIRFDPKHPEVLRAVDFILARARSASHGIEEQETREDLADIVEQWAKRSRDGRAEGSLNYWEKKAPYGKTSPHLMYAAEEGTRHGLLAWPTPNSMREVEPSTAFTLKRIRKN